MKSDTFLMRRFLVILGLLALLGVVPAEQAAAATLRVGVVDSEVTWVNFEQQNWGQNRVPAVKSFLSGQGYDVVSLVDADLESRAALDGLDVLVLPLTRVINESASMNIRDWVADGGALVTVFIGPRMTPRPGCSWTGGSHPRNTPNWESKWTCTGRPDGGFAFWVLEMTSSVWELGPLSEAYQKTFVNDPTPRTFTIEDEATSHPVVAGTKSALGISSIALHRPVPGAGAEFSLRYNSNTTSLLEFSIPPGTGSAEGVNTSQYDGYTAAQAIEYGTGRIVYFDFSVLDFLPAVNASLAAQTHQGTTQGAIAAELITRSIDWTAGSGTNRPPSVYGRSYGEVDIYNTGIYVRQYVENTATHAVHGDAHIRVLDPSGNVVFTGQKLGLGLYPGMTRLLYNWSYVPGGQLRSDGPYTVEVDFVFTYPDYDQLHLERAVVSKNQGIGIPTVTVSTGDLPTRLAGPDRYATAAAISKATFAPSVPVVFIATASNFPDALATVPAAIVGEGPILLTAPTVLPAATRTELTRLQPDRIVVVGGTGAVSDSVRSLLGGYTSGSVVRVAGGDRFSTAAAVSQYAFSGGAATVYIATAFGFPDALAGGPYAGRTPGPVLLTSKDSLPATTVGEIQRLGATKAVLLGGTAVVGSGVASQLTALGLSVSRIAGADRYRTAAEVSKASNPGGASIVYIATAFSFPDALAGGVAAGLDGVPVLLVGSTVPGPTATELTRLGPAEIRILGGEGAVSLAVAVELAGYETG